PETPATPPAQPALLARLSIAGPARPSPLPDKVNLAAFSPDGKTLAIVPGTAKQQLTLYDMTSRGGDRQWLPITGATGVVFSPDGKSLAVSAPWEGKYEALVRVWDLAAAREVASIPTRLPTTRQPLAFTPDSKTLLMEDAKGKLIQVEAATGKV